MRRSSWAHSAGIVLVWLVSETGTAADFVEVSITDALDALNVRACYAEPAATRLVLPDRSEAGQTRLLESSSGWQLDRRRARIQALPGAKRNASDCVSYQVSVEEPRSRSGRRSWDAMKETGALISDARNWLWRPSDAADREIEIRFLLADGTGVSAPWPRIGGPGEMPRFRFVDTPSSWPVRVSFGNVHVATVQVASAELHVAALGDNGRNALPDMTRWLAEAGNAVTTLYGEFPLPEAQLLVMPIGSADQPVPFGQVLRGGGPSAFFYVDTSYPLQEFRADWTAVHELSHMLLPYVGSANRWLSEGVASYYQNVLRARAGMISEETAWRKLLEGFDRGRGQSGSRTLRSASDQGGWNSTMRIYWSGAAIALLADVGYRVQTNGAASMDTALAALAACCLPSSRQWTVDEVSRQLDNAAGASVLAEVVDRWLDSKQFPDVDRTMKELGISRNGRDVSLDDQTPLAGLRKKIMNPRPLPGHQTPAADSPAG
jgi:hypothetical protein